MGSKARGAQGRAAYRCLGLTQKEADIVNSIPPDYIGGNVDDWRFGKGATLYYPVSIDGAFFSRRYACRHRGW